MNLRLWGDLSYSSFSVIGFKFTDSVDSTES